VRHDRDDRARNRWNGAERPLKSHAHSPDFRLPCGYLVTVRVFFAEVDVR